MRPGQDVFSRIVKFDKNDQDERRVILLVIPNKMLEVILFNYQEFDKVAFPLFNGLPARTKLLGLYYDTPRKGFVLELQHDSFEIVPQGLMPPFSLDYELEILEISSEKLL